MTNVSETERTSATMPDILTCPHDGEPLAPVEDVADVLTCPAGHRAPIVRGVPRFVEDENYALSFGIQWQHWSRTQLDSANGTQIFRQRFQRYFGDPGQLLDGLRVLDAGCGAGQFIDIVHPYPAELFAMDLSPAIDAAKSNFGSLDHVHFVQGDIFHAPFPEESFDFVYCIGVIQSTPDPERAFAALARLVRPGGRLAVWIYERSPIEALEPRQLLRRYTKHLPEGEQAIRWVERYAPRAFRFRQRVKRLPGGSWISKAVPVPDIYNWPDDAAAQLSDELIQEWTVMDTHDWLISRYELPQTAKTVRSWYLRYGFEPPQWGEAEHIAMMGTKRAS